jgi:hypothetical protein
MGGCGADGGQLRSDRVVVSEARDRHQAFVTKLFHGTEYYQVHYPSLSREAGLYSDAERDDWNV